MENHKYNLSLPGDLQGVVVGEGNTVTIHTQRGEEKSIPYLAPRLPNYTLVGRDATLEEIKSYALQGKAIPIFGLPGMGKSTLAAAFAWQNLEPYFSDGVLWAGLGPNANEHTVLSVLATWGLELGIPPEKIENYKTVDERAKAVAAAIGNRKVLMVADDVWKIEIALPFRIGGRNSAVLLTTRIPNVADTFGEGLVVEAGEISPEDSLDLMGRLAGTVALGEVELLRQLTGEVGGCPLALVLIGNRLRSEAKTGQLRRVRHVLERLNSARERLSVSELPDPTRRPPYLAPGVPLSLKAAIEVSIEPLTKEAKQVLRAVSELPPKPNSISEEALLKIIAARHEFIDELIDSGLLEAAESGRFFLHQTIADYALHYMKAPERFGSLVYTNALGYFADLCERNSKRMRSQLSTIDKEFQNINYLLSTTPQENTAGDFLRCLLASQNYLELKGLYSLAADHLQRGIKASETTGNTKNLLGITTNIGRISERMGDYPAAQQFYERALHIAREEGNLGEVTYLLQNLGVLASRIGDPQACETFLMEALILARRRGDRLRTGVILKNLGAQAVRTGDFSRSAAYLKEAADLTVDLEDGSRYAAVLMNLGFLYINLGDYERAEQQLVRGLEITRALSHHDKTCLLLTYMGLLCMKRGRFFESESHLDEGLRLATSIGHQQRESLLSTMLGHLATIKGEYAKARAYLERGLKVARTTQNGENECVALIYLGHLNFMEGDLETAASLLHEGLGVCKKIQYVRLEALLLNERGRLELALGHVARARHDFSQSLRLSKRMGDPELIALSYFGLALLAASQGRKEHGARYGNRSLKLLTDIGHCQIDEVRKWLLSIPGEGAASGA
jgi:tetratricopeptide (TPR) repeat protein